MRGGCTAAPGTYLFTNDAGSGPAPLDYLVQTIITPTLQRNDVVWRGWHAFRRGLATNLHGLGVADLVIQAILRHSDVSVTRQAYIKRDSADAPSLAAMLALERLVCNACATKRAIVQP